MEAQTSQQSATYIDDAAVVELEEVSAAVDLLPVESTSAPTDPFAVTAVLSRTLSVTREQWLKLTRNASDPESSLFTEEQLVQALQSPGKEELITAAGLLTLPKAALPGLLSFAGRYWHRQRSIFGLPVLDPTSKVSAWQGIVMTVLDGTYSAFLVPITIAFSADLNKWCWNTIVDMIAGALFTADILLLFHTGFYITCSLRKRLITDGGFVAHYYMLHGTFLTDVLATIPAWIEFVVLVFLKTRTPTLLLLLLNYMRLFRLLRLLRFMGNLYASSSGQLGKRLNAWVSSTLLYFLSVVYLATVLINFFGCVWYWVARREGLTNSWLTSVGGEDLSGASDIRQWIVALYFAMTTVTTVGYGDITAHSAVEQCVAIVMMLAGVLFFGILIGSLGEIVQHASIRARQAQMFRRKFEEVEAWMHHRRLPKLTQKKIRNYYACFWVRLADLKEADLFGELPAHLRGEVAGFLMEEVFEQSDFFSELGLGAKARLAARLTPQMIPSGHDLCQEGDEADCMWILQEGEVLALGQNKAAELLPAPAVIGEAVILRDQLPAAAFRPCTFRALGSCTVWHLALKDIQTLGHVYPDMLPAMIEAFRDRWEQHLHEADSNIKDPSNSTVIGLDATAGAIPVSSPSILRRTTADMATQTMLAGVDEEALFTSQAAHLPPSHVAVPHHNHMHQSPVLSSHQHAAGWAEHSAHAGAIPAVHAHSGVSVSAIEVAVTAAEEESFMHAGSHAASAPESNSSMPLHLHGTVPRSMMQPQQPQHWQQQQQHLLSNTPGLSAVPERQSCIGAGTMQQQTSFGASCAHATGRASVNRPGSMSRQAARSRRSSTVTGLEGMRGSDATVGDIAPRRYARQISHSSDLGMASGTWLAGAFANRLLYRQRMHDSLQPGLDSHSHEQ